MIEVEVPENVYEHILNELSLSFTEKDQGRALRFAKARIQMKVDEAEMLDREATAGEINADCQ